MSFARVCCLRAFDVASRSYFTTQRSAAACTLKIKLCQIRCLSLTAQLNKDGMLYSKNHEYLKITDSKARLGITDHAQRELGDVVFVELPELEAKEAGEVACTVESVKAVAEVYMPVDGSVTAVNEKLREEPSLVNTAWDSNGWLIEFEITKPEQLKSLMDDDAYKNYLEATD